MFTGERSMKRWIGEFCLIIIVFMALSTFCTPALSIKFDNWQRQTTQEITVYPYETAYNNPPDPPKITGPTAGKKAVSYTYNFTITDPDDDLLFNLEIDWGDGTETMDCGCGKSWQSGTVVSITHRWKRSQTYLITARVSDAYGMYSNWSDPFILSIPKQRAYNFFERIQLFAPTRSYFLV